MLLQDKGSVQTMDGRPHYHRKQMFMSIMTPKNIQQLVNITVEQWHQRLEQWKTRDRIIFHEEMTTILCCAVCQWAGIPLSESEAKQRTREFVAMIDGSGAVGLRNWWGQLLRTRTEQWAQEIIEAVRTNQRSVPKGSVIDVIATHQDLEGRRLDPKIAAVELINILRPTVAVAWYITFIALALHEYPECREKLFSDEKDYPDWFVHEVRRFYPFFPAVGGHVKKAFDWRDYHFAKGTWVLLDIYGTNRDSRIWQEAETFRPERFQHWNKSAFNYIPQGGGDTHEGHRCPGEKITIELSKVALNLLTRAMQYDVPAQDLIFDLSRMPALPKSRFIMSQIKPL